MMPVGAREQLNREEVLVPWMQPTDREPSDGLSPQRGRLASAAARRRRGLMRYLREPEVLVPGAFFLILVAFCFLGPIILGLPNPDATPANIAKDSLLPVGSHGHLLGTDVDGRDVWSRLLHGAQVSIIVGIGATAIGFVIGSLIGTLSGYLGGAVDSVVMRLLDIQLAFPGLILALAIAAFLGPSTWHVIIALSFFSIPGYGRLTRANALRIRERDFIAASRSMGASIWYVMRRHMSPNIVPAMLTFAFLQVGNVMLAEAGLSFLGAGVPFPNPSLGNMIQLGFGYFRTRPDFIFYPALLLFMFVLSLNLLSNGVRRVAASEVS